MARTLVLLMLAALAAASCSDGEDPQPTPGSPTASSDASSSATATAVPASPLTGDDVIDLATETAATTIFGADSGDFLNDLPLLTTGDVNGDGLEDLLIGARFGDGPGNSRAESGEAYLVMGRSPLPATIDLGAGEEDVTVFGEAKNDQLAFHGALGDVNGDGLDDIIVSSPFARNSTGAVYVTFGAPELPGVIDYSDAPPDLLLLGPHRGSFFGDSVALDDINGDGVDDVIVGATFARRPQDVTNPGAQAGAVYVIFGGDNIQGQKDTAAGDQDVLIYGENSDPHPDEFGDTVYGADLNGDGFGDIIVTAEAADGPNDDRSVGAEVHIFFGSADIGGTLDLVDGDQDVSVWGAEQNDTLGFALSAGDINGDGVADLIATARGGDGLNNAVPEAGEIHIILGGDLPKNIDLLSDESDASVYGNHPADMLAYVVSTVDLAGSGDGLLMVGSGFADASTERRDTGAVYIIDASDLSGPVAAGQTPLVLAVFGPHGDQLGAAATGGDMDGDGAAELIILALRADGPDQSRTDAGEIYIVRP